MDGNIVYAPASWDALYIFNLTNGESLGNPIIDANGNICILSNNGTAISLLNSNLELIASTTLDGTCNKLISDANGNIYTVDNNGYIYYATYTSSSLTCSKTKFNINPVSSAMACYDGELYIGDNNGILWAFNTNPLNQKLNESLSWAFDAGSAIVGNIAVDNYGTVYIGTDNRHFYAIEH